MNSNWSIWLIFGLLLTSLIAFLFFSFIRDKRKKTKLNIKRIELKKATEKTSKELSIKINILIQETFNKLKEVQPGTSQIKMRHVISVSRTFLKDIYDSKSFKVIYIESDDADLVFPNNIKKLIEINANLWNKYCKEQIEYFEKIDNDSEKDEKYKTIKNETIEFIEKMYEEALKK